MSKQELLRRAAELIGIDELAARLGSPQHLIEAWMKAQATMPDRKLVKLADILADVAERRGR